MPPRTHAMVRNGEGFRCEACDFAGDLTAAIGHAVRHQYDVHAALVLGMPVRRRRP